jgi:PII-like signaling protein
MSRVESVAVCLRIFIGEADRWRHRPLFDGIVEVAKAEGLAGTTVLRGIEGFGADAHLHSTRILRLSENLPIIIEIIDTRERIDRFLPKLDAMITEGVVTISPVHVIAYRTSSSVDGIVSGTSQGVSRVPKSDGAIE